jgi:hypothetical protein
MPEPTWRRSSACKDSANCVEIAFVGDVALVRDGKDPGAVLRFDAGEWAAFIEGVRSGEFDAGRLGAS